MLLLMMILLMAYKTFKSALNNQSEDISEDKKQQMNQAKNAFCQYYLAFSALYLCKI